MQFIHEIGVSDKNGTPLKLNDKVDLFGQQGTIMYECGAYGIGFQTCIDWDPIADSIEPITGCPNSAMFCQIECAIETGAFLPR